jgi:heptosyltransferase-2
MKKYKNILIIRTDRIGDVVLSTPVIKVLRQAYPKSKISFMARPCTKDILKGNPYLDDVITYDKYNRQRSWMASIKFALKLRRKKFDLALILHATKRAHIITFIAKIPERIGYDKDFGFLLSKRIKDEKFKGLKHEAEYNFDLLKLLGIRNISKETSINVSESDLDQIDSILKERNFSHKDDFFVIHPAASCPSKIWPQSNFNKVAQRLIQELGLKLVLVCTGENQNLCEKVAKGISGDEAIVLTDLPINRLAALFKRAKFLISNDSGPVHIAVASSCPAVDIFGRNQPGLSPRRWGPLDEASIVLHRPPDCKPCLAHNCQLNFACLKNINVEDVFNAAKKIYQNINC